nr:hypothetical protein [uncultured bacterium]
MSLGEIARAFGGGGDGHVVESLGHQLALPFQTDEKEQLVAVAIELAGDEGGAADVETFGVVAVEIPLAAVHVVTPGVSVEVFVAVEEVTGAVQVPGAAFSHDFDLSAGGTAELGGLGIGDDLHFGDHIDVGGGEGAAIRTGIDIGNSIESEVILITAIAVGHDATQATGIDDTGEDAGQIKEAASIFGELFDLAGGEDAGALGAGGLHGIYLSFDGDGLIQSTDTENDVAEADAVVGEDLDFFLLEFLEARRFHRKSVSARLDLGEYEGAVYTGGAIAVGPLFLTVQGDFGVGDRGLLTILHDARNGSRNLLCEGKLGAAKNKH